MFGKSAATADNYSSGQKFLQEALAGLTGAVGLLTKYNIIETWDLVSQSAQPVIPNIINAGAALNTFLVMAAC